MMWKELKVEGGIKLRWPSRMALGLLVGCSFIPLFLMVWDTATASARFRNIGEDVNIWFRFLSVIIGSLMLLIVGVRAAGSVGGERDNDTMISLLTTPLTISEILFAKWCAAILSAKWPLLWLAVATICALLLEGLQLAAVGLLMLSMIGPLVCFASLGLLCSVVTKTSMRALISTILLGLLIGGGHWLFVVLCCLMPTRGNFQSAEFFIGFEVGLTPPAVFAFVPFRNWSEWNFSSRDMNGLFGGVLGALMWPIIGYVLYATALEQFRRRFRGDDLSRPRRAVIMKPQPITSRNLP